MQDKLTTERLVFFSDAVIAIAITLLALELHIARGHDKLTFAVVWQEWPSIATFMLSFINIANFWRMHHNFFRYIKSIDERTIVINLAWLFFLVLLPFSASTLGSYFGQRVATTMYAANVLLITVCQNFIWDYSERSKQIEEHEDKEVLSRFRWFCNLDVLNALACLIVCWFFPVVGFVLLFFKVPFAFFAGIYWRRFRQAHDIPKRKIGRKQ